MKLRILQYNVQKSKNGVMVPLVNGSHTPYDIIAIQEPWLNLMLNITYYPRSCKYNLVFPQQGRARTCLLINKQIPLARWRAGAEADYSWVQIDFESGPITIHNVYSESPRTYGTTE